LSGDGDRDAEEAEAEAEEGLLRVGEDVGDEGDGDGEGEFVSVFPPCCSAC